MKMHKSRTVTRARAIISTTERAAVFENGVNGLTCIVTINNIDILLHISIVCL